jgi:acyl dehydratase
MNRVAPAAELADAFAGAADPIRNDGPGSGTRGSGMNLHAPAPVDVVSLKRRVGQEIGMSAWHEISQSMIDRFADVTSDHQFIHVDPARAAAEAPFGGTIAHGFLTLSLLSVMAQEALPPIEGRVMGVNYGFDRVRFVSPVRSGARVRGRFRLAGVKERSAGEISLHHHVTVEIAGDRKPALAADWITLAVLG